MIEIGNSIHLQGSGQAKKLAQVVYRGTIDLKGLNLSLNCYFVNSTGVSRQFCV
jgi:hypothetical protein